MDPAARALIILFAAVWGGLFSFYGFLGVRAWLWSPHWAVAPTTRPPSSRPARAASDRPHARGRRLYRALRCGVCHGPDGQGGVKNPNADPDGMVPNLYDLAEGFTREDLKNKLRKGAHAAKNEEEGADPPLDMPAWSVLLAEEELDALTQYLFELKPPPGSEPASAAGGDGDAE